MTTEGRADQESPVAATYKEKIRSFKVALVNNLILILGHPQAAQFVRLSIVSAKQIQSYLLFYHLTCNYLKGLLGYFHHLQTHTAFV